MSVYDINEIRSGARYNDRGFTTETIEQWEDSFNRGMLSAEDTADILDYVKKLSNRMWYVNSYIDHVATEINRNLSNADEGEIGMSEDELYEFADVLRALEL